MEAILRAVAQVPEAASAWVLRGGLLSQWWSQPYPRPADDVDFLALYPFDQARSDRLIDALPGVVRAADTEVIWEETASPGLRYQLRAHGAQVQVDLGFGDPLDPPPVWWTYPSLEAPQPRLQVIRPETGAAWKLHGLFEELERHWRSKDLHDLWLILHHATLDPALLSGAIRLAFESRRTPLWVMDRLMAGAKGQSRSSQKRWERLQAELPPPIPPLREAADTLARRLAPVVEALHPPLPVPGDGDAPFPHLTHLDEILPAVQGDPVFRLYDRGDYQILNAEQYGADSFPAPTALCSARSRRYRLLRRECRGLVFDAAGRLLARRYHKFFHLGDREESRLEGLLGTGPAPLVLEKLDGALLCPARLPGGVRLLSRRGISPLSESAEAFAQGTGHPALWADLLEDGWTPLLEWCHRDHRIVVEHPRPRLVLTGVRHTRTGAYQPHPAVAALGERYGVEVVQSRGHAADLRALVRQIEDETTGEGVILRFEDGRFFKLKTLRYRRLHRALEATERERARWEVLLLGEGPLLRALLPPEEAAAFAALEAEVRATVARRARELAAQAEEHRAAGGTVEALAYGARALLGPERAALFAAWGGAADAEAAMWAAIRRSTDGGRGLAELRRWFMPDDRSGRAEPPSR